MDNYNRILDLIEHPDDYSTQEIEALLTDGEMRELYNLLCKTADSCRSGEIEDADTEAQWRAFSRKNFRKSFPKLKFSSRVASISALAIASAAALAIGAGVAVKYVSDRSVKAGKVEVAFATEATGAAPADTIIKETKDNGAEATILFENEKLATVLKALSNHYIKEVRYLDPAAGELYIYFRWDSALPLEDVIDQLNTFGQINLRLDSDTIIIDRP